MVAVTLILTVDLSWGQIQTSGEVKIKLFSNEITFSDPTFSATVYRGLKTQEMEANLVHQLWFKNAEYLFCKKGMGHMHSCHVYLSNSENGDLSSYEKDPDFGKGDVVEAIVTRPMKAKAKYRIEKDKLVLEIEGSAADWLYSKIGLASEEFHEDYKEKKTWGEHISCLQKINEDQNVVSVTSKCSILVPTKWNMEEGKPLFHY